MDTQKKQQAINSSATDGKLDGLHHIAIQVQDVQSALDWYTSNFDCVVEYVDATWAYLRFENIKLALVIPGQHPPHICFISPDAARFGALKDHRDGTQSVYVKDPAGNSVEILQE